MKKSGFLFLEDKGPKHHQLLRRLAKAPLYARPGAAGGPRHRQLSTGQLLATLPASCRQVPAAAGEVPASAGKVPTGSGKLHGAGGSREAREHPVPVTTLPPRTKLEPKEP